MDGSLPLVLQHLRVILSAPECLPQKELSICADCLQLWGKKREQTSSNKTVFSKLFVSPEVTVNLIEMCLGLGQMYLCLELRHDRTMMQSQNHKKIIKMSPRTFHFQVH